ncbi:MAG: hypothetical protein LWW93_10510 [Hyphomicrobiales bacterium]|nr:hypothetical protein [Hyphomicrobiales bacterium]
MENRRRRRDEFGRAAIALAVILSSGIGPAEACGADPADSCIVRGTLAVGCPNADDLREVKRLVAGHLNPIPLMGEKGCVLFPRGTAMWAEGGVAPSGPTWRLRDAKRASSFWMDAADFK